MTALLSTLIGEIVNDNSASVLAAPRGRIGFNGFTAAQEMEDVRCFHLFVSRNRGGDRCRKCLMAGLR